MNKNLRPQLTLLESNDLQYREQIIQKGLKTFIEVGDALAFIRDNRLYRKDHDTFESYCRDRWGFSRVQAHRLMEASEVVNMLPIGNKITTESQAREVAKVEPDHRVEVIEKATQATGGKLTAKAIREAKFQSVAEQKMAEGIPIYEQQGMTKQGFQAGMCFQGALRNIVEEMKKYDPQDVADGSTPDEREEIRENFDFIKNYRDQLIAKL